MKTKVRVVAAVLVFFVAYFIITLFQTERRRCNKLDSLWSESSGSLLELSTKSKQISDATSDKELKFAADFLSTIASAFYDGGVRDLSEVKRGSNVDMLATGFVNGIVNPIGSVKSIAKTIWLAWNKSDCEKAFAVLEGRYGGLNGWAIFFGFAGAVACFKVLEFYPVPNKTVQEAIAPPVVPTPV